MRFLKSSEYVSSGICSLKERGAGIVGSGIATGVCGFGATTCSDIVSWVDAMIAGFGLEAVAEKSSGIGA
jgi:F0F1-type ATP synthase membrane subunit c/vacuolar-type H+-ATPase subunit K